jgi:hypothetical protein
MYRRTASSAQQYPGGRADGRRLRAGKARAALRALACARAHLVPAFGARVHESLAAPGALGIVMAQRSAALRAPLAAAARALDEVCIHLRAAVRARRRIG